MFRGSPYPPEDDYNLKQHGIYQVLLPAPFSRAICLAKAADTTAPSHLSAHQQPCLERPIRRLYEVELLPTGALDDVNQELALELKSPVPAILHSKA